jgi:hypothetical protein
MAYFAANGPKGQCASGRIGDRDSFRRLAHRCQPLDPTAGIECHNQSITLIRKTGLFVNRICFINEARRRERSAGEDCTTMEEHMISPIDRLMILTVGAVSSWLAVGGVALGASKLIKYLF